MKTFYIHRNKDDVVVGILKHKLTNKYHFINFTKEHICPCEFDSEEEAIEDLEKYKQSGKIINYVKCW